MPEKLVRLHESAVAKLQATRLKIQELLNLSEPPTEDFVFSASLHVGFDLLDKANTTTPEKVFYNTKLIEWLSDFYQKWLRERSESSQGASSNGNGAEGVKTDDNVSNGTGQ